MLHPLTWNLPPAALEGVPDPTPAVPPGGLQSEVQAETSGLPSLCPGPALLNKQDSPMQSDCFRNGTLTPIPKDVCILLP